MDENDQENWPTHRIEGDFWEELGRTVATFGFLEDVLTRAIFLLSGTSPTKSKDEQSLEAEVEAWQATLEQALFKELNWLKEQFVSKLKKHPIANSTGVVELGRELETIRIWRNTLCHASWQTTDDEGIPVPRFFNKQLERFEGPVSLQTLKRVRLGTRDIILEIIRVSETSGHPFPGKNKDTA